MTSSACGFWCSSITDSFTGIQTNAYILKTAITLPGELETLTTADGSPMHIIGHATITLHLKNLRVTHHFILVESLMTDVILGIDFQREYRISYEEKRCYIRYKGQFLCYTEDMESGID